MNLKLWIFFFPAFIFGQSWAENTLLKMTLEEKIGQLFIAPACPMRGEDHWNDWLDLIQNYHIGGAITKQADPASHVRFVNRLQKITPCPLLITADAEWGLAMRISDTVAFPKNGILGQIGDLDLIHKIGLEIGKQCKRLGIHLNFSPVADVNTNPSNPVIGVRSFGDNPTWVAQCVVEMLKGLQEGGVMACAKHFPGHGDTALDSHVELPTVSHDKKRLRTTELSPFKKAIENGVSAIMTAHILVPCLDPKFPATLSPAVIETHLRKEMHFEGLIVTDALNMKALSTYYSPQKIAYYAHVAGCDLLLYGDHVAPRIDDIVRNQIPRVYNCLLESYRNKELPLSLLDEKVLRILRAKEKMGLHLQKEVDPKGVAEFLHREDVCDLVSYIESKRGL